MKRSTSILKGGLFTGGIDFFFIIPLFSIEVVGVTEDGACVTGFTGSQRAGFSRDYFPFYGVLIGAATICLLTSEFMATCFFASDKG